MRRIDRTCLADMRSPVRHLMAESLAHSIFNVAPERGEEFNTALDDFDLVYVAQRAWKFCADPERREITVSRGAVELVWCMSLAHFAFYSRLIAGKKFDHPVEIDPQSDPSVRDSLRLLRWAIECQLKGDESDDWLAGCPQPRPSSLMESNEAVADELSLVTCAYLLHHELAHIRLRHSAAVDDCLSRSQEKDADIEAAQWVLDGIDPQGPVFKKRALGIVQGFLLGTVMGLYRNDFGGTRHPYSYDRLASFLHRVLSGADHVAWAFAFAVLDLHFNNSGRMLPKQDFADSREALEAICDQLAEETRRRESAGRIP
jgi:hypothetical protein